MWWLAIPGVLIGAWLLEKYKERDAGVVPTGLAKVKADTQLLHDLTAASYLKHLGRAARAAAVLEQWKSAALAGDVEALMSAPGLFEAMHDLAEPFDVLTLQRDLNVLGAMPPLSENGILDKRTKFAVASLQKKFGMHADGDVNSDLRFALAYSVGRIYAQDLAPLCGGA
jgi:hypothetical protein